MCDDASSICLVCCGWVHGIAETAFFGIIYTVPFGGGRPRLIAASLYGPLAHLVERLICTEEVAGSIPVGSTTKEKTSTAGCLFFCCGSRSHVLPAGKTGEAGEPRARTRGARPFEGFHKLCEMKDPKGILVM